MSNQWHSAFILATELICKIVTTRGKEIRVAYVSKTTDWRRVLLAESVQQDFAGMMEKKKDTFRPGTVEVAMKEPKHANAADPRQHFTVYGLNKYGEVFWVRHFYATGEEYEENEDESESDGESDDGGGSVCDGDHDDGGEDGCEDESPGEGESDGKEDSDDEDVARFEAETWPYTLF
ncbi:hypothetical protein BDY17DRAFT_321550 [Neohortaea acidophila]|uniref:Uncharacterized protein n=1 Tax=Neohortaea acidophila TaxID=245834 RepID=A0A6A6Q468_9PEZI|nr:uncharacterized protein BDY17DRAFT_321550 [Neohortaea acidophila]KAF2486784.1 hypothetical protein BDY17DRAFT_321550 [Neohortaea acidophila]